AVGRAEVSGDVAALLLATREGKGADLLIGGDERSADVLADIGIGQGVHTERLGVVSGKGRVFKVAADVQDHHQLALLRGPLAGPGRVGVKLDRGAERVAGRRVEDGGDLR